MIKNTRAAVLDVSCAHLIPVDDQHGILCDLPWFGWIRQINQNIGVPALQDGFAAIRIEFCLANCLQMLRVDFADLHQLPAALVSPEGRAAIAFAQDRLGAMKS